MIGCTDEWLQPATGNVLLLTVDSQGCGKRPETLITRNSLGRGIKKE